MHETAIRFQQVGKVFSRKGRFTALENLSFEIARGEYVCIVEKKGESQREEMTVMVEAVDGLAGDAAFQSQLEARLHDVLGVKVVVQIAAKGALDAYTGLTQTSKIKRLIDKRKEAAKR